MTPQPNKKRVAILGGGPAALAAAFELTNEPASRERHEITIYQQGFRLGGKLASGKRATPSGPRVEDHGFHVLLGFYRETLALLTRCYDELDLALDDALQGVDTIHFFDRTGAKPWALKLRRSGSLEAALGAPAPPTSASFASALARRVAPPPPAIEGYETLLTRDVAPVEAPSVEALRGVLAEGKAVDRFAEYAAGILRDPGASAEARATAVELLRRFRDAYVPREPERQGLEACDGSDRRERIVLNILATITIGLATRGETGIEALDDEDFREWLERHGADPEAVRSPLIDAAYKLTFTPEGDLGAATALTGASRLISFDDALFYLPRGGMGEVMVAPLYLALRRRGVKFAWFHAVEDVKADGGRVSEILLRRQVDLAVTEYDPLLPAAKGDPEWRRYWPVEPRYEQIARGDELKQTGYDLESHFSDWRSWKDSHPVKLEVGKDFDEVVLAIPIGAIRHVCKSLLETCQPLRTCAEQLATTATRSAQLSFSKPLDDAGWRRRGGVLAACPGDFDTWADMTQGLPARSDHAALVYLCGPFPAATAMHATERRAASMADAEVDESTRAWLEANLPKVWPGATTSDIRDWYVRANVNPSDQYVQCRRGTSRYRLDARGAQIENLVLAGDWVRTELNAGCVEAAVSSGVLAARALDPTCAFGGRGGRVNAEEGGGAQGAGPSDLLAVRAEAPVRAGGEYVEYDGDATWPGPFKYSEAVLYSFVVRCDAHALQRACDRTLNRVSGVTRYRPLGGFVMIECTQALRATSMSPKSLKGYLQSHAIAVTIPVLACEPQEQRGKTVHVPKRLRLYSPYIFVDTAQEMAAGREMYGMVKLLGERMEKSSWQQKDAPERFSVHTRAVPAPGELVSMVPVLEVNRIDAQVPAEPRRMASPLTDLMQVILRESLVDPDDVLAQLAFALDDAAIGLVGLRQIRDTRDTTRAVVQEVIETPLSIDRAARGALLGSRYAVTLHGDYVTLGIGRELGLPPGQPLPVVAAARFDLPFYIIGEARPGAAA